MIRTLTLSAAVALGFAASPALAAGGGDSHVTNYEFSFEGMFGTYDQMQLQRGLQVYTEICSACHGLKFVPLRTLHDDGGPGLPEDQVRAYADFYEVWDPTLFDGEGDFRPAIPSDNFPAVTSAAAPDLSLMAKARAGFHGPYGLGINQFLNGMGGPEYIASLLTVTKIHPLAHLTTWTAPTTPYLQSAAILTNARTKTAATNTLAAGSACHSLSMAMT